MKSGELSLGNEDFMLAKISQMKIKFSRKCLTWKVWEVKQLCIEFFIENKRRICFHNNILLATHYGNYNTL